MVASESFEEIFTLKCVYDFINHLLDGVGDGFQKVYELGTCSTSAYVGEGFGYRKIVAVV